MGGGFIRLLLSVIAVIAGYGCTTKHSVYPMINAFPVSPSVKEIRPAITVLPITEAFSAGANQNSGNDGSTQNSGNDPYKADQTYLGGGIRQYVGSFMILPGGGPHEVFKADMARTDIVKQALVSALKNNGIRVDEQARGHAEQPATPWGDGMSLSVSVRKFNVDTSMTSILPLVIWLVINWDDTTAHVILDCKLTQQGQETALWEGTVEGKSEVKGSHTGLQYDISEVKESANPVIPAVNDAVKECITKSGVVERHAALRANHTYAKFLKSGMEQEIAKDTARAIYSYAQAYGLATAGSESDEAMQRLTLLIKPMPMEKVKDVLNAKDDNGNTMLINAARYNHTAFAGALIEKGVDVNAMDDYGNTALHSAARANNLSMARLLLEKGAGVNAVDSSGKTPLLMAAYGKDNGVIAKLLLEKGADVSAMDNSGNITFAVATANNNLSLLAAIKPALAKAEAEKMAKALKAEAEKRDRAAANERASALARSSSNPVRQASTAGPSTGATIRFQYFNENNPKDRRDWGLYNATTYVESQTNGVVTAFRIIGQGVVDNQTGTIVRRLPDEKVEYFIPDMGSATMWVSFRNLPKSEWTYLSPMQAAEGAVQAEPVYSQPMDNRHQPGQDHRNDEREAQRQAERGSCVASCEASADACNSGCAAGGIADVGLGLLFGGLRGGLEKAAKGGAECLAACASKKSSCMSNCN